MYQNCRNELRACEFGIRHAIKSITDFHIDSKPECSISTTPEKVHLEIFTLPVFSAAMNIRKNFDIHFP